MSNYQVKKEGQLIIREHRPTDEARRQEELRINAEERPDQAKRIKKLESTLEIATCQDCKKDFYANPEKIKGYVCPSCFIAREQTSTEQGIYPISPGTNRSGGVDFSQKCIIIILD